MIHVKDFLLCCSKWTQRCFLGITWKVSFWSLMHPTVSFHTPSASTFFQPTHILKEPLRLFNNLKLLELRLVLAVLIDFHQCLVIQNSVSSVGCADKIFVVPVQFKTYWSLLPIACSYIWDYLKKNKLTHRVTVIQCYFERVDLLTETRKKLSIANIQKIGCLNLPFVRH